MQYLFSKTLNDSMRFPNTLIDPFLHSSEFIILSSMTARQAVSPLEH